MLSTSCFELTLSVSQSNSQGNMLSIYEFFLELWYFLSKKITFIYIKFVEESLGKWFASVLKVTIENITFLDKLTMCRKWNDFIHTLQNLLNHTGNSYISQKKNYITIQKLLYHPCNYSAYWLRWIRNSESQSLSKCKQFL